MRSTGSCPMLRPSKRMTPARARTRPDSVRSSEVLPAPLAPRTAVMLPWATSNDTPFSARTGPYAVSSSSTCSIDLDSEIGVEHALVGLDLGGRPVRDAAAEVEHDDAVADRHDEVDAVLDEQHRHVAAEGADALAQLLHVVAAEPAGRLVEEDELRARDERPRQRDALLDGVRQRGGGGGGGVRGAPGVARPRPPRP